MAPTIVARTPIAADFQAALISRSQSSIVFRTPPVVLSILSAGAIVLSLIFLLLVSIKVRNWLRRLPEDEEVAVKSKTLPRTLLLPTVLDKSTPATFLPSATRSGFSRTSIIQPKFISVPVGVHVKHSTRWFESSGLEWRKNAINQKNIRNINTCSYYEDEDLPVSEVLHWIQLLDVIERDNFVPEVDIPDLFLVEPSIDIGDFGAQRASIHVFDLRIGSTVRRGSFLDVPNTLKRKDESADSPSKRRRVDSASEAPEADDNASIVSCDSVLSWVLEVDIADNLAEHHYGCESSVLDVDIDQKLPARVDEDPMHIILQALRSTENCIPNSPRGKRRKALGTSHTHGRSAKKHRIKHQDDKENQVPVAVRGGTAVSLRTR